MGGLKSKMPKTYWTMLAGVSAISGLPLLSGFFSKDEILWFTYSSQSGGNFIFIVGLLTAILTAFYMFRLFFLSFHGDSRWTKGTTPHESPPVMTVPLILLAVLSVTGGWIGIPEILGGGNSFHHFLSETVHDVVGPHPTDLLLSELTAMVLSITGALVGIYVAFRRYGTGKLDSEPKGFGHLVEKKYYVDELYDAVIVQPIRRGSESIWRRFDVRVIDGIVNGLGSLTLRVSSFVRRAQTGVIQNYAAVILLGVILIILLRLSEMSWLNEHILTVLILLPLAGVGFLLAARSLGNEFLKRGAFLITVLEFLLSLILFTGFEATAKFQFTEQTVWIPAWGINYSVGVDGISLFLILLTTFLMPIAVLASWKSVEKSVTSSLFRF
jgi:NADH:ubiquinone oxidoreductase subunit 5 (subunit L)/multisubunit Na+/H+ antiporter MnhA subunit